MTYDEEERIDALKIIARSGGKPMTPCPVCGSRYLFTGKGRPKMYCSDKCRVAANRQKNRDKLNENRGLTTGETYDTHE